MNKILECISRSIFKSWFIDFDPVHAKVEGRDPNLPDEIAALFPAAFEASVLGKILNGWRVKQLGDLAKLCRGSNTFNKKTRILGEGDYNLGNSKTFVCI